MKDSSYRDLAFVGVLALAAGCRIADAERLAPTAATAPTVADRAAAAGLGVPLIQTRHGLCSGTLLTSSSVLTADHCFEAADVASPGTVDVSLENGSTAIGAQITLQPGRNVAVVRLATPLSFRPARLGRDGRAATWWPHDRASPFDGSIHRVTLEHADRY